MRVRVEQGWDAGLVRVLEWDADLLTGAEPAAAARAARGVVVRAIAVPAAAPLQLRDLPADAFGLLVLDGLLARRVELAGRASVELLGAGDVMRPWQDADPVSTVPVQACWRALQPSRLALLDREFVRAVETLPPVITALAGRLVQRCHALAARLAIAQMPRLEDRLMALLWHLADRWGRVEPDRVTVPLCLSHGMLAELLCAQRPSVSVAVRHLAVEGRVARSPAGGWELFGVPPAGVHEPAAALAL